MNKRELSKVFSKLSREEVNLESHKVDLTLVDDYSKRLKKTIDAASEASFSITRGKAQLEGAIKNAEILVKMQVEIEKSAKELGVLPPIKGDDAKQKLKDLSEIKSTLSSIKSNF
jgi:hypothetical protein